MRLYFFEMLHKLGLNILNMAFCTTSLFSVIVAAALHKTYGFFSESGSFLHETKSNQTFFTLISIVFNFSLKCFLYATPIPVISISVSVI